MIKLIFLFALCAFVSSYAPPQDDESFYLPGSEIVNEELRNAIVNVHNRFRASLNAGTPMRWNYRLELFAQLRARELMLGAVYDQYDHRPYPDKERMLPYTENLGVSTGFLLNIPGLALHAIEGWKNETILAMGDENIVRELETTATDARKAEVLSTLEKKAEKEMYEYGHAYMMARWDQENIGCSYSFGRGNTTKWDFYFVCQYSFSPIPEIPDMAWNAPLFDLVTDATAAEHPTSPISITRSLRGNPNNYVARPWSWRKKDGVPSLNYATFGLKNLIKTTSPYTSATEFLGMQATPSSEPAPEAKPARLPSSPPESVPGPPPPAPKRSSALPTVPADAPASESDSHRSNTLARAPSTPKTAPPASHEEVSKPKASGPRFVKPNSFLSMNVRRVPVPNGEPEPKSTNVAASRKPVSTCKRQFGTFCIGYNVA